MPPITPHTNSPIPTEIAKAKYPSVTPYAYMSTKGTINILAIIFGSVATHFNLSGSPRNVYATHAPKRVAKLQNTMSQITHPLSMLAIIHPRYRPIIASGINIGRIQSASEMRNCIAPLESPKIVDTYVSPTYSAAMSAPRVSRRVDKDVRLTFLFIFFSFSFVFVGGFRLFGEEGLELTVSHISANAKIRNGHYSNTSFGKMQYFLEKKE